MSWWEILIVISVALFSVAIIAISIIKKKKGKTGCCCDCSCCPYHNGCSNVVKKIKTNI